MLRPYQWKYFHNIILRHVISLCFECIIVQDLPLIRNNVTRSSEQLPSDSDATSLHESHPPWKKPKKGSGKWLLDVRLLLQQEQLAVNGDLSEDEDSAVTQERVLSKLSPKSLEWYRRTYDALLWYALGLKQLLNNCKKKDTLHEVITKASCSFLHTYV
ncbi:hypothetical protein F5141DRAFT_1067898 [Pisolithus sp. B1]|nr:hypothetical protein F5141DRAFT_1067898 [Pisolithus sp. B1]